MSIRRIRKGTRLNDTQDRNKNDEEKERKERQQARWE